MKTITFRPTSKEVEALVPSPKPAREYMPTWFKKIPRFDNNKMYIDTGGNANTTIKACMPFMDTFTSGYIQETWCDIYIKANKDSFEYKVSGGPEIVSHRDLDKQYYPPIDSYNNREFTWKQPWIPQLPDGYSMLYIQPFNRYDLPFLNLTAIIDNDKFFMENNTNHPFFLKENFEGIIPRGTPYMQMLPIKRDQWKSNVGEFDEMLSLKVGKIRQFFVGGYKKLCWQKKEYN